MDPDNYNRDAFEDGRQYQNVRTMNNMALAAGLCSLIVGGVLLSGIAVLMAWLGRRKIKILTAKGGSIATDVQTLVKKNKLSLIVSILALIANIIILVVIFPEILDYFTSLGSTEAIDTLNVGSGTAGTTGSVW